MTELKMPINEIEDRYRKSEIYMMGWRSREQAVQLKRRAKKPQRPLPVSQPPNQMDAIAKNLRQKLTRPLVAEPPKKKRAPAFAGLPDQFINKDGEVDLSQVSGKEALAFLGAQGLHMPVFMR